MARHITQPFFIKLVKWDVLLRLFFGPFIFFSPVGATIVNLVLDGFDGEVFKRSGYDRSRYSIYDKVLDYWWYVWIFVYILATSVPMQPVFVAFFIYRTIGQILFLRYHKGFLLFLFPNIFELLFFYYLFAHEFGYESVFFAPKNFMIAISVLSLIGLLREIIIHMKQMNFSAVYLGKTSYWPKITRTTYKALIFFSIILSGTLVYSNFIKQYQTETYVGNAQTSEAVGQIISYDAQGRLMGKINEKYTITDVQVLKTVGEKKKLICHNSSLLLLPSNDPSGDLQKKTYIFVYEAPCLVSLKNGAFELLLTGNLTSKSAEIILNFEVYDTKLR